MSNLLNIQNAIKSVSRELVKAKHEGDDEKIEDLEVELADLEDEYDYENERSQGFDDWD